jgi:stage V sporulation protein D (sporulation-specific penicillin-binding protein)
LAKQKQKRKTGQSERLYLRAMIVLFLLTIVGFIGFGGYGLVNVMLIHGKEYAEDAKAIQQSSKEVPAPRGAIYTANNLQTPIAQSATADRVYINPSRLDNCPKKEEVLDALCKNLAPLLGITEEKIRKQASYTAYQDMTLKGQVGYLTMQKVNAFLSTEFELKRDSKNKPVMQTYSHYVGTQPDVIREYPKGSFAGNVIGFTGMGDIGRTGLELYYNKQLIGTAGRVLESPNVESDLFSAAYDEMQAPTPGNSLVLTIDEKIQEFLERSLEQAKTDAQAKAAYGIVMEVKTGKILGMASVTSYDPGDYERIADEKKRAEIEAITDETERKKEYNNAMFAQWRNGAIELTYEPGSVFKTVTVAAALEENVISMDETYTCTGSIHIANRTISCHNRSGHGTQDLTKGLMNSCNPFMINIGQKLGVERFYKYFSGFGFTEKTGIDLPGEAKPTEGLTIHAKNKMGTVELASCSFGQSFEASPIQILSAVAAIANGGKLMKPYVVDKIIDADNRVVSQTVPTVRRQVISAQTAEKVAGMMEQVVIAGTGKNGYVAGARVAGKTGTSEKLSAGEGYVASFCAFAPVDAPEVAMLIAIDEPVGLINGGQIAAPPAAEIMEEVLVYKNIEMRYNEKEQAELGGITPKMTGLTVEKARENARNDGYQVRVIGGGASVVRQLPENGQSIAKNGLLVLYTDASAENQTTVVPKLTSMSISEANRIAAEAGLNITLTGNFDSNYLTTYRQSIAEGDKVPLGTTVTVHFVSNNGVIDR